MTNAVQVQYPAVVLRSSYQLVRALLSIATIAIVGLTIAVVTLALNNAASPTANPSAPVNPSAQANTYVITDNPGHWKH